jgi:Uncharacterized protein conserved in bacteria
MTPYERELILSVASRLREAKVQDKDAEAEALIRDEIETQKDSAYVLTQAVILQEHALKKAQERVRALTSELAQVRQHAGASEQRGGFLGGLFGGERRSQPLSARPPANQQYATPGANVQNAPGQFGSFMQSAAAAALGVAGGALLFSGISNLFGNEESTGSAPLIDENTNVSENITNDTFADPDTADPARANAGDSQQDEPGFDDSSFDSGGDDEGFFT